MAASGCVRLHVVEPIDGGTVAAGHEMAVDVHRHLDRAMPHLIANVGEALALLNEQRREGAGGDRAAACAAGSAPS